MDEYRLRLVPSGALERSHHKKTRSWKSFLFADPTDDFQSRSNLDSHKFIDKSLELEMGWAVD